MAVKSVNQCFQGTQDSKKTLSDANEERVPGVHIEKRLLT